MTGVLNGIRQSLFHQVQKENRIQCVSGRITLKPDSIITPVKPHRNRPTGSQNSELNPSSLTHSPETFPLAGNLPFFYSSTVIAVHIRNSRPKVSQRNSPPEISPKDHSSAVIQMNQFYKIKIPTPPSLHVQAHNLSFRHDKISLYARFKM